MREQATRMRAEGLVWMCAHAVEAGTIPAANNIHFRLILAAFWLQPVGSALLNAQGAI